VASPIHDARSGDAEPRFLLDVTRLIWRAWRGRRPTGIDRVCLAYLEWFGARAQAVIQRRGMMFVLSSRQSARLGRTLLADRPSRFELIRALAPALLTARRSPPARGVTYLNVGHTGVDESALLRWVKRHDVRAIYLVHDLIPITHPQFCRSGEQQRHARRIENMLASASGIIGNSRDTLSELTKFANLNRLPMPTGVAAGIAGVEPPADVEPKRIGRPYFLTVGTIEARKNHVMLLEIWERLETSLGSDAPLLVIIGQRGWEAEHAFRKLDDLRTRTSSVREISNCDDSELASWIGGARALLMPSFVEGFGLPIVEALQLGTPVIASDLEVFHEIAADIPTFLDPNDPDRWEEAVRSFIQDGAERSRQLAKIDEFKAPTWEKHFTTVENWLSEFQR
jgi:glycosyltransferase involved in cell wall biosynthesis